MNGENILEFEDISKSFFGVYALKDVSISLPCGHIVGLVGENGAGKTTLMNILGGVIKLDKGRMILRGEEYAPHNPKYAGDAGIAFIHQELNLFVNMSICDNVFIDRFPRIRGLGLINKRRMRRRTAELLEMVDLDVSPNTLVERLSPGQQQLVEVAKALNLGADIIIFDEPTTSLTANETEKLFSIIARLKATEKSMFYISHNLGNVLDLADEIVVIRDGEVVDKAAKQQYTVQRMISKMVGRDIERMYPPRKSSPSSEVALEVRGLSQPGIVKDVSFEVRKGEVLGLFGLMGSGRTELARMIFGLDEYESGEVVVGGSVMTSRSPVSSIGSGMAFVTENRREEGLFMDGTILANLSLVCLADYAKLAGAGMLNRRRMLDSAAEVARSLRIKCGPIEKELAQNLSGGNQQKVVIGKWVLSEPSVFIMDEPTRGIDVGAKYEVHSLINGLAGRGTGVLFISSELEELMAGCDRIIVMGNGEIQGGFDRKDFDEQEILQAAFKGHRRHSAVKRVN